MPNGFFEPFANNGGGGGSGSGTVTSVGITPGGGISVTGGPITDSGSIEVAHADTSSQASVDNSGRSFIQDVTLDEYGHVTELGTGLSIGLDQNGVSYTDEDKHTYTGHVTDEIFNDYSNNIAVGGYSHAEGSGTIASAYYSHAEGFHTSASGLSSHAEGDITIASAYGAHAEGKQTTASGLGSHAEGDKTIASGEYAHVEGSDTIASGDQSHAEGLGTRASGSGSHAEGVGTLASNQGSHAEGNQTTASGLDSHAEGSYTIAFGDYSHVEGLGTQATKAYQHVQGKYNVIQGVNDTEMAMIIGNGTANNARSNALSIDWDGNIYSHNDPEGIDIRSIIAFGDCESTADTQHKVVTMADNNWRRHIGCIIAVKFKYTNSYAASSENPITLNVNGTGDMNIRYGGSTINPQSQPKIYGYAGRYNYFIWNGTDWVWFGHDQDANTEYSTIAEANITNSSSSTGGLISGARAKAAVDKYAFGTNTLVPYDVTPHSDLNNYTTPGTYYVNSNAHAADVDNCPIPIGGRLIVMTTISDDYLLQVYYTNQEVPQIFVRRRVIPSSDPLDTTSPWSKWVCVTFATNGIEIPDNADLDDYTTPGVYNHGLDNVATLSNCPITISGFRLEVVHIAFNTRRQQRLYPQSTTSKSFFIRTEDSNGFGDWIEYADVTTIKNEIFGPGTLISSGAITGLAPGRYYTQDSSNITELPNGFSGAFYCTVEKTISTNSDAQGIRLKITLQPCETVNLDKTYTRFKTGSGWSGWYLSQSTAVT